MRRVGGNKLRGIRSAAVLPAATAGGIAARRMLATRGPAIPMMPGRKREPGWLVATVYRSPTDIAPEGHLPEPLERLGDAVDVQIRPAPGDRGTELSARPRLAAHGTRAATRDAWRTVRLALRGAKQLRATGGGPQTGSPPPPRETVVHTPLADATRQRPDAG